MHSWAKVAIPAAAIALAASITGASASTNSGAPTHVVQPGATAVHTLTKADQAAGRAVARAASPSAITPAALVDTTVESKYTPIAPCRIVDTRIAGGAIAANSSRSFHALGAGSFAGQGGTSCDIPYSATAVTGSIISVDATGTGYLKVYGWGATEPTASFLNYVTSPILSASGTIPVAGSTDDFTVKAFGHKTEAVIQLTGYYIRPMWTEVASNATYLQGSRTTALSSLGTGLYEVDYDRNISACAYTANSYTAGVTVEVEPRVTNADGVFIATEDSTGALVDATFYLTVTC